MKKGLLLAGAVFGLSVLAGSANAVTIRIDEEQVLKFGFRGIIDARYLGDKGQNDKADLSFIHRQARIYAKYRLNKVVSFGFQAFLWTNRALNTTVEPQDGIEIVDSFINLAFAPEFQVIAGSFKVPFQRHSGLQSGFTVLFPTGPTYGNFRHAITTGLNSHVFTNPVADRPFRSSNRSAGITAWGNIADGMFKYYVGIFDITDETGVAGTPEPKTAWAVRVQFTPTMLGYKGEKGYVLSNTYVGKKDVLTIGLSYVSQPYSANGVAGVDDQTSWGFDIMWEQKFGTLVPNFQVGYVNHKSWGGTNNDDRYGWLVQGQLLYDQKIFIGKPAVAFRYVKSKCDDVGCAVGTQKPELTTWGVAVQYYLKGVKNRISLAVDSVNLDNVNLAGTGWDDSYTDVTLSIFYNF